MGFLLTQCGRESFGALVGSDYVYNANGDKVIDPATGRYLRNNNQVIGNITPDWVGGIRNSFRYKDFSVSFLIDVKKRRRCILH